MPQEAQPATLQEFALNLLNDPAALSAFELDPEGVLSSCGLSDITPGDVQEILPLVLDAASIADVDGLSLLPTLIGEAAAGHPQEQHDFLYWEINGWTAIRQGDWRAVRPKAGGRWELHDLAADPGEAKDLAASQPARLARLVELAASAHEPVREGTFDATDLHERDRRAKYGKHDDPSYIATPSGVRRED